MDFRPPADLTAEAKETEEMMHAVRRQIRNGSSVPTREVIDAGMRTADFLCKLSGRTEYERNRDMIVWLQQTRRSMRAMLREYWMDILGERRPAYTNGAVGAKVPAR